MKFSALGTQSEREQRWNFCKRIGNKNFSTRIVKSFRPHENKAIEYQDYEKWEIIPMGSEIKILKNGLNITLSSIVYYKQSWMYLYLW